MKYTRDAIFTEAILRKPDGEKEPWPGDVTVIPTADWQRLVELVNKLPVGHREIDAIIAKVEAAND